MLIRIVVRITGHIVLDNPIHIRIIPVVSKVRRRSTECRKVRKCFQEVSDVGSNPNVVWLQTDKTALVTFEGTYLLLKTPCVFVFFIHIRSFL